MADAPVVGTRIATRFLGAAVGNGLGGGTITGRGGGGGATRGGGAGGGLVEQAAIVAVSASNAARCHQPTRARMNPGMDETLLTSGLYIVATPIGNLGDLSPRAADILSRADLIAAEDTRVTARLLRHIGVKRPMTPYHDHNADAVRPGLIARLARESVVLVSDAGTPLVSDPGFKLVRDARAAGHAVVTIPGPCAAIAALTLAGLPTSRFMFVGFLPAKSGQRRAALAELAHIGATLVFYESATRLAASLALMTEILGDREATVARELTKYFEEAVGGRLSVLAARYALAPPRGEIVIVVGPPEPVVATLSALDAAIAALLPGTPDRMAATDIAARLGLPRRTVYTRLLSRAKR